MERLLFDCTTAGDDVDLATRFVVNGATDRTNRVDVLDLTPRAKWCAWLVHRHIDVAAHRTFFHLGVAGTNCEQDGAQF